MGEGVVTVAYLVAFVIDPEFVIVLLLMVGLIAVVVGVVDLVVDSEPVGVLWMMIVLVFALEGRWEEGARVADQKWLLVLVIRVGFEGESEPVCCA